MAGATKPAKFDTGVGERAVNGTWVLLLTLLFGFQALALLALLLLTWPPSYDGSVTSIPDTNFTLGGTAYSVTREQSLLLMVALAGAVGAMGHVIRSFFRYAGDRKLVWSWVPSYVLTPFLGALMATITYIVLRAGFIGVAGASLGNPFGFAAVALLVGLFSAQAIEKLKKIFETIFTTTEQGSNPEESVGGQDGTTATAAVTDATTGSTVTATATSNGDGTDGTSTTVVVPGDGGGAAASPGDTSTEVGPVVVASDSGAATNGHVADATASGNGTAAAVVAGGPAAPADAGSDGAAVAGSEDGTSTELGAAAAQDDEDDDSDVVPQDADDDEDAKGYETTFENNPDAPDGAADDDAVPAPPTDPPGAPVPGG